MTRAVLDANVLVSAILSSQGVPAQVLMAWRGQAFDLLISLTILDELDRVLCYPKLIKRHGWTEYERRDFLADLVALAIPTPGNLTVTVVADDPADDCYLSCSIEGEAGARQPGNGVLMVVSSPERSG